MHHRHHVPILVAAAMYALTGCGSAVASVPATVTTGALEGMAAAVSAAASSSTVCPAARTSSGMLDCSRLPLGDLRYSTSGAKSGSIYLCRAPQGMRPVVSSAPWLGASTWNAYAKIAVHGAVAWNGSFLQQLTGSERTISGDGLPVALATTGIFPIAPSDPAYQYDRNPNGIAAYAVQFTLPATPTPAASPGCMGGGAIGITTNGVAIYDAFDAAGYDGVAHEVQDGCHGHPDRSQTYHVHGWLQACVHDAGSATNNSSLLGYAFDGFGIYGPWYDGKVLTSADLDACHGTTRPVRWNGRIVSIYHYVSTYDFPYTLGCFKGRLAS